MLEEPPRRPVAFIVVCSVIVLAFLSLPIIEGEICKQYANASEAKCSANDILLVLVQPYGEWFRWIEPGLIAISTFAIAIFTWRLVVSTDKLWEESRNASGIAKQSADAATRAADVAEKTLIITQRAYISAKEYRTEAIKDDDTNVIGWKIALVWENTGNTPGIQFEAGVYLQEIEVAHEPEPFGLTNREMSAKATIGAKTPMTSRCRLTLDQAERIRSGKIDVFLCGRAEYRDIFPDTGPHHTSVCMKLSIEDPTFKRVNPFGYNAYQKYNEAT